MSRGVFFFPCVFLPLITRRARSCVCPCAHSGTQHEEYLFRDYLTNIIRTHDPTTPLFLNYNPKLIHYPLQAPQEYQDKFAHIETPNRLVYAAMVNFLDDQLKNVTGELKAAGLWDNTLMILTSDNGGFVRAFLSLLL